MLERGLVNGSFKHVQFTPHTLLTLPLSRVSKRLFSVQGKARGSQQARRSRDDVNANDPIPGQQAGLSTARHLSDEEVCLARPLFPKNGLADWQK